MNRSMLQTFGRARWAAWLIALLLAPWCQAMAQPAADLRVSPVEPDSRILPAGAAIQSSAAHGTSRLVVWGTTRNQARDTLVNLLVTRLLRDGKEPGPEWVVSGPEARPEGFVKVLPTDGAFVVIWNDTRQRFPGVYLRRVGLDGAPLEPERRISGNYVLASIGNPELPLWIAFGTPASGWGIAWQGAGETYFGIEITSRGLPRDSAFAFGGRGLRSITYRSRPDILLLVPKDAPGRILYRTGRYDRETIPAERLSRSFYLEPDLRLVSVIGSRVNFYATPFAAVSTRSVAVPAIDSAALAVVTADSTGRYLIYLGMVSNVTGDAGGVRRITFYRAFLDRDSASELEVAYDQGLAYGRMFDGGSFYSYIGAYQGTECSNTSVMGFDWYLVEYYHGDPLQPRDVLTSFGVDERGRLVTTDAELSGLASPINCLPAAPETVRRAPSDSSSRVSDTIGTARVTLETPCGSLPVNGSQTAPGIMHRGDTLLVEWMHEARAVRLATWDGRRPGTIEWTLEPRKQSPVTAPNLPGATASTSRNSVEIAARQHERGGLVSVLRELNGSYSYWRTPKVYYPCEVRSSDLTIYSVERSAARTVIFSASSYDYGDPDSWSEESTTAELHGYDPSRQEMLIRTRTEWGNKDSLIALDSSGARAWTMPVRGSGEFLPIGRRDYIRIVGATAQHERDGDTIGRFDLTRLDGSVTRVLRNGDILRHAQLPREGSRPIRFVVERWSVDGARRAARTIEIPTAMADPVMIESPEDSSLMLLYVRDGVRMTRLTRSLDPAVQDSLISSARSGISHPSAVIVGDTLYAVWEDTRNGAPDIYGNRVALTPMRDTTADTTGGPAARITEHDAVMRGVSSIDGVYPNPASGDAYVEARIVEAGTIELIDALGRVALSVPVAGWRGVQRITLPVSELRSGAYLVRLRGGGTTAIARLMVTR